MRKYEYSYISGDLVNIYNEIGTFLYVRRVFSQDGKRVIVIHGTVYRLLENEQLEAIEE
jgi:hypothetical protein